MTVQKETEKTGEKGLDNPLFEASQFVVKARKIASQLASAQAELGQDLIAISNKSTELFTLAYELALSGETGIVIDQILDIVDELNRVKRNMLMETVRIELTRRENKLGE
jgi:hypothetical protein